MVKSARTFSKNGRAVAQAVSCRPPTAEDRVRSLASPCGICGGQVFPPSTSVFPCQFHSTGAPLLGNVKKKSSFSSSSSQGLHNKPYGCGVSVASAAEPISKKKRIFCMETPLIVSNQTPTCFSPPKSLSRSSKY